MKINIVSWNIAGGHPVASLEQHHYASEDLDYFIKELRSLDPDIICLQEAHTPKKDGKTNAERIAKGLGMQDVFNSPASNSHVDPTCMLSTATLSKIPFVKTEVTFYPNPDVPLFWKKDGTPAETHEKNIQTVDFGEFAIANNQMLPITLFGYTYQDDSYGGKLAKGINDVMKEVVPQKPLLWCGDFNFDDPLAIYPYMRERKLKDALPEEGTRLTNDGSRKRSDHIFYTPEFRLMNAEVRKTNTDHYLCYAEFEL